jgi:hypothetical protein
VGGGEQRRRAQKGRSAHARETATHCLIRPVNVGLARQQKVDDFDLVGPGRGDERRRACAWDAAAAAAARGRRKQGGGGGGRGGSGGRGDAPAHRASHIHPSAGRHWRKTATTREHARARIAGARARKRARALTVFVALVHHFWVRSQDFAHARQVAAGGAPHELCAGGGAARLLQHHDVLHPQVHRRRHQRLVRRPRPRLRCPRLHRLQPLQCLCERHLLRRRRRTAPV